MFLECRTSGNLHTVLSLLLEKVGLVLSEESLKTIFAHFLKPLYQHNTYKTPRRNYLIIS